MIPWYAASVTGLIVAITALVMHYAATRNSNGNGKSQPPAPPAKSP